MSSMIARAGIELVALHSQRKASGPTSFAYPEALKESPRALSVVTFRRGSDRFGVTATSISSLSEDPPTILVSFDGSVGTSPTKGVTPSFGVNVLAAGQLELADRFRRESLLDVGAADLEGSWIEVPSGVVLRSDSVVAFECESEETIERHGRAIVIGRILNVFRIGGSGALVYWRANTIRSDGATMRFKGQWDGPLQRGEHCLARRPATAADGKPIVNHLKRHAGGP